MNLLRFSSKPRVRLTGTIPNNQIGAPVFLKNSFIPSCGFVIALTLSTMLSAAPRLGLTTTALTVAIVPGQNGPAQSVDA